MSEFKVNDKVYFPCYGTSIFIVSTNSYNEDLNKYPFEVGAKTFTVHGKSGEYGPLQDIFHATPENHALLERLYGVEFEAPPHQPTSREIITTMIKNGYRYVPCCVSSDTEKPNEGSYLDFIICVKGDGRFYNQFGRGWKYATPFDPRTGEAITELPT